MGFNKSLKEIILKDGGGGGAHSSSDSENLNGSNTKGASGTSAQQGFNMTENVDKLEAYTAPTWNGGSGAGSQSNIDRLAQDYLNSSYDSFTKGNDYASLAKRYSDQGRQAMDDTIGQMAARTGGLASSYAATAGQQAYGDWMGRLEDAARSLYDSQMAEKASKLGVAQGLYDRQYSEFKDNRNWDYQMHQDELDNAKYMDTAAYNQYQLDESTKEKDLSDFQDDVYSTLYLAEDIDSMTYEQFKATYGGEIPEGFSENDFKMIQREISDQRLSAWNEAHESGKATMTESEVKAAFDKYENEGVEPSKEALYNYEKINGIGYFEEKIKTERSDSETEKRDAFYDDLLNQWESIDREGFFAWIEDHSDHPAAQRFNEIISESTGEPSGTPRFSSDGEVWSESFDDAGDFLSKRGGDIVNSVTGAINTGSLEKGAEYLWDSAINGTSEFLTEDLPNFGQWIGDVREYNKNKKK